MSERKNAAGMWGRGFRPDAGLLPGVFESRKPAELRKIGASRTQDHVGRKPGGAFKTPGAAGGAQPETDTGHAWRKPGGGAEAPTPQGRFITVRGPQAHRDRAEALPHTVWLVVFLFPLAASAAEFTLIDAIKDQNTKAVTALVAHADVNARQPDGSTPLSWAVYKDNAATVDLLLKAGAKVATADDYGETPLTLACANGDAPIVDKLIKAGADVNAPRYYNETPLMIAAASGNPAVVQALIAHGAKVEEVEARRGQNALMWAAADGNSDAVAVLLKAGANPNALSKGGFTPLVFIAENGDAKSAASLIAAGANVNYEVPRASGPLLIAVTSKKWAVASLLIDSGASVTAKDPTGTTPLHTAVELGDMVTVQHLIAKGADVNAATVPRQGDRLGILQRPPTGQQTPLMIAARVNRPDIMKVLVVAGANPKLHATDGSTLLMAAASGGHIESVQYAFELDPDIKAMTDRKETVMHASMIGTRRYATEEEVTAMVKFLAEHGGELDSMDINNRTPIALAKIIPLDSTIDMLTKMIIASGSTPKPSKAR